MNTKHIKDKNLSEETYVDVCADLAPIKVLGEKFQLKMNYVSDQKSFRGAHQLVCLELDLGVWKNKNNFAIVTINHTIFSFSSFSDI